MIQRILARRLKTELAEYPVVTVFGPRQSGKTTIVRSTCPTFNYVSLEDKETRDAAATDYKALYGTVQLLGSNKAVFLSYQAYAKALP